MAVFGSWEDPDNVSSDRCRRAEHRYGYVVRLLAGRDQTGRLQQRQGGKDSRIPAQRANDAVQILPRAYRRVRFWMANRESTALQAGLSLPRRNKSSRQLSCLRQGLRLDIAE